MISLLAILTALAIPPQDLRSVTPGTRDVSPLARDLAVRQSPIIRPNGFDTVYEIPGESGRRPKFGRINGALVAEFPRSEYIETDFGSLPVLPGGTRFRFLNTPMPVEQYVPAAHPRPIKPLEPLTTRSEGDSMWQSELVRRSRVSALLSRI